MMFSRKVPAEIFGILLAASMVAFAQQPTQTPSPNQEGFRRERMELKQRHPGMQGHMRMRSRGRGLGHVMRELNLSETQREQIREITRRRLEATKTQREELFKMREKRIAGTLAADDKARVKALHKEIRSAMKGIRAEIEAALTAEQKARLEQLKAERKARIEERKSERKMRIEQQIKQRQEPLNKNPF